MDSVAESQPRNDIDMTRCCSKEEPVYVITFDGTPDPKYSQKVCETCSKDPLYSKFVVNVVSIQTHKVVSI